MFVSFFHRFSPSPLFALSLFPSKNFVCYCARNAFPAISTLAKTSLFLGGRKKLNRISSGGIRALFSNDGTPSKRRIGHDAPQSAVICCLFGVPGSLLLLGGCPHRSAIQRAVASSRGGAQSSFQLWPDAFTLRPQFRVACRPYFRAQSQRSRDAQRQGHLRRHSQEIQAHRHVRRAQLRQV